MKRASADEVTENRAVASANILAVLAATIGWLFLMPLMPEMPTTGLDPSWRFALNVAVSPGLVFGRDVLFTFGPLGAIYTQLYSPATDHHHDGGERCVWRRIMRDACPGGVSS
jgi:hypothetical protein